MSTLQEEDILGDTIIGFSRDALFPEKDEVSALQVQSAALPVALNALASAKTQLENEVRKISSNSASEVDTWISHAKALQEDVDRSRSLANDIVRQVDASAALEGAVKDTEDRVEFVSKEVKYSYQVGVTLRAIRNIQDLLNKAEQMAVERKLLTALHILSSAWDIIYGIPGIGRTRAVRLLDERAFVLRASIHENFNAVWDALAQVDVDSGSVIIHNDIEVDAMDIKSAIIIMTAYEELDDRVRKFSKSLGEAILRPRFDLKVGTLLSIDIKDNTLRISSAQADRTIKSLLFDLDRIIIFLDEHLPIEFSHPLSKELMPKLCSQIKETWLDSAVPTSLDDMTAFRKAITLVQGFADKLQARQWTGAEELRDWVENAPRIWLTKRRETCLDWTRNQLSLGVSYSRKVERVETQKISRDERKHIISNGNTNGGDWDAAWSDDGNGDGSLETQEKLSTYHDSPFAAGSSTGRPGNDSSTLDGDQEDDVADAWGWGDDEAADGDLIRQENVSSEKDFDALVREKYLDTIEEVTLKEKYAISSMPEPVLKTITSIIEDGAILMQEINEHNPVSAAATGLFALPSLVLAMYRAISPYHYNLSIAGNMYLYNDAMWLAEQLEDCGTKWKTREDLIPRIHGKVKLENEVQMLEKFSRRAYGSEMNIQRTVLTDLLGGAQNFLQQDGQSATDDEIAVDSVISHIRTLAAEWKEILSKSAWAQAIGSLLSTVAKKIIFDVEDLTFLGADEAYRVAHLISKIVNLDDLFLPDQKHQPQIPVTSQYAPNWLKLHFLSEVLQSDLNDVKYLWFESDLSLYFTAQEVVELVELSFEKNQRTREAIASIRNNSRPREG